MRKIVLFVLMLLIMPLSVNASNKIHSIDIDIYLNEDGSANITETWDVDGDDGTEWYKVMNNLGESKLSDFYVSMDGNDLKYKLWDIDESLSQKRGYYGINYTGDGLELCFGKYDYNRHTFVLNYNLSNFVFSTSDSQVIYFKLIDKLSDVDFDKFSVTVSSYYSFPDNLAVWGYGYEGYAYVKDGKIEMSDEDGNMNNDYVVLLANFPLNTFTNTTYVVDDFDNFEDVLNIAEKGTFLPDFLNGIFEFLGVIIPILFEVSIFVLIIVLINNSGYGYVGNKKIEKKNVPMFRDIPCNKDIYYANALIKLNNFVTKEGNILGAIILKWVKYDKIGFTNKEVGIFNKDTSIIDLTRNPSFDNELETKLFDMMYKASKDGYLEAKEFEKWARNNYSEFFSLFKRMENETIEALKTAGHIYKRRDKSECKKKNVMDDNIYNDSVQLYGLKLYLDEFSRIDTKEVMEVKLWDEYLMFAYLFGIADKVSKQLKDMYPEIWEQPDSNGSVMLDYDMIRFVNHISTKSVSAASSARSAAQSYSSGGGGFSSSGGGGGSFGGGGGGSR